ncbi:hypothetical protein CBER1_07560 [Cercospora berteroae]|uniref:Retrovirus-related Pol polyprotein from transposon TNT 1-94-like beta-barrel domain-containing protein n=1 Tax=Cercospora berteroae TaxID=357750 RepID=A0A2S6CK34_9PEZI|nr:hypothetical protein CBER1_07560 [Cercospora berteroae]
MSRAPLEFSDIKLPSRPQYHQGFDSFSKLTRTLYQTSVSLSDTAQRVMEIMASALGQLSAILLLYGGLWLTFFLCVHLYARFAHRFENWDQSAYKRFLIDSGAGGHITWDRDMLENYKPYRVPRPCSGATGSHFLLGIGDALVPFVQRDGTLQYVLIHGVSYMPQMPETILSTELLGQQGIMWSSEGQSLYRRRDDGTKEEIGVTEVVRNVPWLKKPNASAKSDLQVGISRKPTGTWSRLWQRFALGKGKLVEDDVTTWDPDLYGNDEVDKLIDEVAAQQREIAMLRSRLDQRDPQ